MRPCIYCGIRPGNTKDHVPPKCLFHFPPPRNTQLITVPCCEDCRRAGESDEALYRNLFISTRESERHPIAQKLAEKRDRCLEEDPTQFRLAVEHMVAVRATTPRGSIVAPGFDFDSAPMHGFVLRMCRALLHKETKCGYRECRIVNWKTNPEEELREIPQAGRGRVVSDEFAYAGIFMPGEKTSVWLLNFYQSLEFFAIMETQWDQSLGSL